MLTRSLRNVQGADVGLDREHLLLLDVDVRSRGYAGARLATLAREMSGRLAAIPGVSAVTYSVNGIFSGTDSGQSFEIPGYVMRNADDSTVAYDQVGTGYISSIGGRLIDGRDLSARDEDGPAHVVIVNQAFAKHYFPRENAVGQFIHLQDSMLVQIVGVAADMRDHELKSAPPPRMYFSYMQPNTLLGAPQWLRLMIRAKNDPETLIQPVRKIVVAIDPSLPIDGIDPLPELMQQSIREQRLVAKLASAFGVLALLLASVGLYGIMSYAITRRTREIGLRVALGARQQDIVRTTVFEALWLAAAGMGIGIPLALASVRLCVRTSSSASARSTCRRSAWRLPY